MGWHNMTNVVDAVTRENSMPFELVPCTVNADYNGKNIQLDNQKILIADDDLLPVGVTYRDSYVPPTVAGFWQILADGLGDTPYTVHSAGTIRNRTQMFASIKISDGFTIGKREFKDFITLMDSCDTSMSCIAVYSNTCVVCSNTFQTALRNGDELGRAKHSKGFNDNVERLVKAIHAFAGTSKEIRDTLIDADMNDCDEAEARCWFAGVNFAGQSTLSLTDVQKVARQGELFRYGRGNLGATRLDAFSALTEFHTHESALRNRGGDGQWMSSEFGSSARIKERALNSLEIWHTVRARGHSLLKKANALIGVSDIIN